MVKRLMLVLVALLCLGAQAATEVIVKSKPVSATVFVSGGAAITRTGVALVGKGRTLLKINDLPKAIDFSTLRIKVDGGAIVMSVKTGVDIVNDQDVAAKAKLDNQIASCDSLYKLTYMRRNVVKSRIELLTKNSSFGPQGLTDPNTQKAYEMYSREIEQLKKSEYDYDNKLEELKANIAECEKSLSKLASKPVNSTFYALVEVESKKEQSLNLVIDYRVGDVLWIPSYDFRAEQLNEQVDLIMKAKIRQNSGEDWKDVKLRLSTAVANQSAKAPKLSSYEIYYGSKPPYEEMPKSEQEFDVNGFSTTGAITGNVLYKDDTTPVIGAVVSVKGSTITTMTDVNGRFSINAGAQNANLTFSFLGLRSEERNLQAGRNNVIYMEPDSEQIQAVVVTAYGTTRQSKALGYSVSTRSSNYQEPEINLINTTEVQNAVSMEIEIDGLSSVPSKQEPYSVDVRRYNLPIFYTHVSAPRIEPSAFMQAKVVGMDKLTLLDGELNMFFDNTLINSSVLRRKNITDTTTFAINRDKRVVVRRDAVEGEPMHKIEGRKWIATRNWKYSVTNNGNLPIVVELSDRVPVSGNKEIGVSFASDITPKSNNDGILTWRIELKPGQSEQFGLRYVVTCPSNRTVYVD